MTTQEGMMCVSIVKVRFVSVMCSVSFNRPEVTGGILRFVHSTVFSKSTTFQFTERLSTFIHLHCENVTLLFLSITDE